MKIKITADSTCDLSEALVKQYDIHVLPLTVMKADQPYLDGVTVTPADIFAHVAAGGSLCSTAAVSVGEYEEVFRKYSEGYDGIVHINIGSGFSACYQNACIAAEEFPKVRVVDSKNLSTGQGLVVLKACDLAAQGLSAGEIAERLKEVRERVEASFLLDRLDYMVKGGRCSSATALGANLLNLKPCIEVRDGKMLVVKKYRGKYAKCLETYVRDRIQGREDSLEHDWLFITHTPVTQECYDAVMKAVRDNNYFGNVYETNAGCTVSCHCGPGTLGVLFIRK